MTNERYNGWSNYETWLVNIWYNPESRGDVEFAKADLEEKYEAMGSSCLADMCSLYRVDWEELLSAVENEEEDKEENEGEPE